MKRSYFYWKASFIMMVLLTCPIVWAVGQSQTISLQHIAFKDKVLESNLNAFVNNARVKAVLIVLERRGNAYLYKFTGIYFYERIKKYPTVSWGQWHNQIIVFNAGPELKDVCTIRDTVVFTNLLQYVRPLLPNMNTHIIGSNKNKPNLSIPAEGLEWVFKVENGKEVWLYDNNGYDSRDMPEMPVPK